MPLDSELSGVRAADEEDYAGKELFLEGVAEDLGASVACCAGEEDGRRGSGGRVYVLDRVEDVVDLLVNVDGS